MSLTAYVSEHDESDAAVIAHVIAKMDELADAILAAEAVDIAQYRALSGWVEWATRTSYLTPTPAHIRALRRLPPAADMHTWQESERRLAAMRDAP